MKSYIQTHLNRFRNALLATFFAATQLIFPLTASGIASAADIPSTKVEISSVGFVLSDPYSVVAGQPTGAGKLKNGNVAAYPEGACIPALFTVTNNDSVAGDTIVSPIFDYYNSVIGVENYEYVTSAATANPISGIDNLNDITFTGSPLSVASSFPTAGGGSVTAAVTGPFAGNDAGTTSTSASDSFRHYNIALSDIPAGYTVNILLCARLGLDASEYSGGASLSLRTVQGGAENVPIPVNQILVLPSITIIKEVSLGDASPSDFSFTVSPSINGQSNYSIPSGESSITIDNVNPDGDYVITESGPAGYMFTGGTGTNCNDIDGTIGTAAGQMTASVAAAKDPDNATCTFSNAVQQGSITIVKNAIPNNDTDFAFTTTGLEGATFSLDDDSDPTLSDTKNFSGLVPGSYSVTESGAQGWDSDGITCSGAKSSIISKDNTTVSINLAAGENITCTFTNRQHGRIIVSKVTIPAEDQTVFSVTASGDNTIHGDDTKDLSTSQDAIFEVSQGIYAVSENLTGTPGWVETSNTCTDLTVNGRTPLVNGVPTVYCTITNTKQATITVKKETLPDGSSQVFGFSASYIQGGFSLKDGESKASGYLTPDTEYTVSETSLLGWDLTNISCESTDTWNQEYNTASITPAAGENVTCTFTNTQRGGISGTKYEANADGTTVGTLSGWTIKLLQDSQEVASVQTDANGEYSFINLTPGSYTLSELLEDTYTQIFAPQAVTLDAGEVDTQNDFGNFKNASITGYKWNDQNGNGIDNDEPRIASWEIQLKEEGNVTATTTTDSNGDYAFANLAPGDYEVCEIQQNGWVQTFPSNDACHNITIDISGETETANFGNQGRGTITVTKNLDTDGDGDIDEYSVNNWTWDIDSSGNYATGSTQNVAAGTYTVSEDQKDSYHVTYSSCSGEENGVVSESLRVTVSAGEDVNCTFTNTRDTALITVNKKVYPSEDNGLFDLRVNDTTYAQDVSDGGTTGSIRVPTGTYDVSEWAGTETNLTDYESTVTCLINSEPLGSANATSFENIVLERDDSVECTFTNTRLATITVNKDAIPDDVQDFEFTLTPKIDVQDVYESILIDEPGIVFSLDDDYDQTLDNTKTINHLSPGIYYITEEEVEGWDLTEISCNLDAIVDQRGSTIAVEVRAGEQLDCVFTNVKRGSITIVKDAAPDSDTEFAFTISDGEISDNFTLVDDGEHEDLSSISYPNLVHGTYTVSEESTKGWTLDDISCGEGLKEGIVEYAADSATIKLAPGADIVCYFTNSRDTGTITVVKKLSPTTDGGRFNLLIGGEIYATAIGDDGTTGEVELATGTYAISETAAEGTLLSDYETVFVCTLDERPLISGFGTSIPDISLEKDQDIICTFTNNKPQVLGAELVNTGVGIAVTSGFAAALLTGLAALWVLSRRQYAKVPIKQK